MSEPAGAAPAQDERAPRKSFARRMFGQWPLAVVLAGVLCGLAIVATSHWRVGCTLIGASMAGGGILRLCLGKHAGLLAVRNRVVDVILLLGVGVGILVLAWLAPPYRN